MSVRKEGFAYVLSWPLAPDLPVELTGTALCDHKWAPIAGGAGWARVFFCDAVTCGTFMRR